MADLDHEVYRPLRLLAEDLVDQFGWSALDSRLRVNEWMHARGLIDDNTDPRQIEQMGDFAESHARWLLS
jgi:hypothetical protein